MTIRGPFGRETTATERMRAARDVRHEAITRELCWASFGSRMFPELHDKRFDAFLMPNAKPQTNYSWLSVLETPVGRMVYRVSDEELVAFSHLPKLKDNDGKPATDKLAALLHLATEGW